jgi:hypothetical protein
MSEASSPFENPNFDHASIGELDKADINEGVAAGYKNLDTLLWHSERLFLEGKPSDVIGKASLVPLTYQHEHLGAEQVVTPEKARQIQEAVLQRLRHELNPKAVPEAVMVLDDEGVALETRRWTATYKKHQIFVYEERENPTTRGTTGLEVKIATYEPDELKRLFTPDRSEQRRQEHTIQATGSIPVSRMVDRTKQLWEAARSPKDIDTEKSLKARKLV